MTIDESKILRQALERDILTLLQKFQSDTGMYPVDVTLQHLDIHPVARPRELRVSGVRVEVVL